PAARRRSVAVACRDHWCEESLALGRRPKPRNGPPPLLRFHEASPASRSSFYPDVP
ncbi:unnamed protein product, partial [Musa banksii]